MKGAENSVNRQGTAESGSGEERPDARGHVKRGCGTEIAVRLIHHVLSSPESHFSLFFLSVP